MFGLKGIIAHARFQLLEGESVEFRRYGLRDNVAQLSVFEVVVVNCKLLVFCKLIYPKGSVNDEGALEIWILAWVGTNM